MFKECLAMLNLRKWSFGRPDTHGYRSRSREPRSSIHVLLDETPDEDEPAADAESLMSFAKVADSDISENEFENENFFGGPTLVTLSENVPESNSFRSSRHVPSPAPNSSYRSQRSSTTSLSSQTISSPAPSFQSNSPLPSQRSSTMISPSPSPLLSTSSGDLNRNSLSSLSSSVISDSYTQQIIALLKDSAAELATLPDIKGSLSSNSNHFSMQQSQMAQTPSMSQQRPMSFFDNQASSVSSAHGSPLLSKGVPSSMATQQTSKPESQEDKRCVVCLDTLRNSTLYPCGHLCVCNPCGKELISRKLNCPMCRAPIKDCIFLYK